MQPAKLCVCTIPTHYCVWMSRNLTLYSQKMAAMHSYYEVLMLSPNNNECTIIITALQCCQLSEWVDCLWAPSICVFLASSIDVHCLLPSFCVVLHCLPLLPAVYLWGHFESKQTETCVCVRSFLVLQLNWLHVLLTEISHHWAPASSSINNSSCRQLHDTFKSINHRSMMHKNGSLMGFVSVCAYSDSIKDVWSVFCLKLLKYTKNAVYKN